MYENIKMIMCDLDGSLTDADHMLTDTTKDTIRHLREKGILFGIASGRPLADSINFYRIWGLDQQPDIIIANNGCELWDAVTQEHRVLATISTDDLREIVTEMKQFPFANPQMYTPGTLLCGFEDEWYLASAKRAHRTPRIAEKSEEFWAEPNVKIMFRMDPSKIPIVEAYWKEHPREKYWSFRTQPGMYEFSTRNASKGSALLKYCELFGLKPEDCMSFGDNMNDLEMIECCTGIAMKNGTDEIKAVAKAVTDLTNVENGLSDFVERYVLSGR